MSGHSVSTFCCEAFCIYLGDVLINIENINIFYRELILMLRLPLLAEDSLVQLCSDILTSSVQ